MPDLTPDDLRPCLDDLWREMVRAISQWNEINGQLVTEKLPPARVARLSASHRFAPGLSRVKMTLTVEVS